MRNRPGRAHWYLDFLPFAALSVLLLWVTCRKPTAETARSILIDPAQSPHRGTQSGAYISLAERELASRSGPGLPGLIPEELDDLGPDPAGAGHAPSTPRRRNPRAFNRMVEKELKRLSKITRRYYRNEPVVREVDRAFASLPRYMAVKRRFDQDRDAYAFARDTMALPEVRRTINKYALDPQVWRVTAGMISEGLKEKPPKPLYDEMKRFFTQDKQALALSAELSASILPHMGSLLPQVVKPGQDLKPLQDLAEDLNISGPPTPDTPGTGKGEIKLGQDRKQQEQQLQDFGKGSKPTRR